jgi:hypothetical protein
MHLELLQKGQTNPMKHPEQPGGTQELVTT